MEILSIHKNMKVGCKTFNLEPIATCKRNAQCHKFCYDLKACRMYPSVLPARRRNYAATLRNDFPALLSQRLTKRDKYFRIHSAGDFYSVDYFMKRCDIARMNPGTVFYAFTKRTDILTQSTTSQRPDNFILILSMDGVCDWPMKRLVAAMKSVSSEGFDSLAAVTSDKSTCAAQKTKGIRCMVECKRCIQRKQVILFKMH